MLGKSVFFIVGKIGGYQEGVGAAAFVVHAYCPESGAVQRIGYIGTYFPDARSPFHAEVQALLAAVEWVRRLLETFTVREI